MQGFFKCDASVVEGDVESPVDADGAIDEGSNVIFDQDISPNVSRFASRGPYVTLDLLSQLLTAAAECNLSAFGSKGGRGDKRLFL